MDVTGKITLDLLELFQDAANRWWAARVDRKRMVAQLREVDTRVNEVVAPSTPDRREQAKVKERLIEREQALSKHMSDREKQVPPVIAPAPTKAPEPSHRVQKEKQAPLFVDSAVEGTLPPISILDPAEKTVELRRATCEVVAQVLDPLVGVLARASRRGLEEVLLVVEFPEASSRSRAALFVGRGLWSLAVSSCCSRRCCRRPPPCSCCRPRVP